MKPGEFDKLIRQKFDQNDFAYNPKNWDQLAERMDGHTKKRSIAIWWLPMMGVAAAISVCMGYATYMHHAVINKTGINNVVAVAATPKNEPIQKNEIVGVGSNEGNKKSNKKPNVPIEKNPCEIIEQNTGYFGISLGNVINSNTNIYKNKKAINKTAPQVNLLGDVDKPLAKLNKVITEKHRVYKTFNDEVESRQSKSAIDVLGGINYAGKSNGSGFMLGTTARTMISHRLYIEGDIAFTGSNNTQRTASLANNDYQSGLYSSSAARTTGNTVSNQPAPETQLNIKVADKEFNMYYAQVTPTIGYQLLKRMSIGVGPDFQQALTDNRPMPSILDRYNVQVAPLFDMGFIYKTEFALNNKIKAAIFYRKGINNIITPMDKYVERNYFQFQLKYMVFNRVK